MKEKWRKTSATNVQQEFTPKAKNSAQCAHQDAYNATYQQRRKVVLANTVKDGKQIGRKENSYEFSNKLWIKDPHKSDARTGFALTVAQSVMDTQVLRKCLLAVEEYLFATSALKV